MFANIVYFVSSAGRARIKATHNLETCLVSLRKASPTEITLEGFIKVPTWHQAKELEAYFRDEYLHENDWSTLTPRMIQTFTHFVYALPSARKDKERLARNEREKQEAEWFELGRQAYADNQPVKSFPKLGCRIEKQPNGKNKYFYSNLYYRVKNAFQAGWYQQEKESGQIRRFISKPQGAQR